MSIGTTTTTPVARKAHTCEVCGKQILPGEKYRRIKGEWEREWQNWAAHDICLDIYDDASEGVTQLCWRELLDMADIPQAIAFLNRFPPEDEDDEAWLRARCRTAYESWAAARAPQAEQGGAEHGA